MKLLVVSVISINLYWVPLICKHCATWGYLIHRTQLLYSKSSLLMLEKEKNKHNFIKMKWAWIDFLEEDESLEDWRLVRSCAYFMNCYYFRECRRQYYKMAPQDLHAQLGILFSQLFNQCKSRYFLKVL